MPTTTPSKSGSSPSDSSQSPTHTLQLPWGTDSPQPPSRRISRGITRGIDPATWEESTDNEPPSPLTDSSPPPDFSSLVYSSTLKRPQALPSGFSRRKLSPGFINRIADLDKDFWEIAKRKPHKLTNSQMKSLAAMRENAKRKREEAEKKEEEELGIEEDAENEENDKKDTEIPVSLTGQMFKFLPEDLRPKIASQFNFIHLPNLPPPAPKKPKPIPMIKVAVGIYHDSAPAHKFRNKTTKSKIGRLVFLSSKPARNGQPAPTLTGEFGELAAESQVLFAEGYETAEKRQSMHGNILKSHAAGLAREEERYWNQVEKWALKRRLWEWETVAMLFDECSSQLYFPLGLDGTIKLIEEWQPSDDPEKGWGIHKPIENIDLGEFDITSDEEGKTGTASSTPSKPEKPPTAPQAESSATAVGKTPTKAAKKPPTPRKPTSKK